MRAEEQAPAGARRPVSDTRWPTANGLTKAESTFLREFKCDVEFATFLPKKLNNSSQLDGSIMSNLDLE